MNDAQPLRGFATLNLWAADLEAAKAWYTEFLGVAPYFQRQETGPPSYIEFRLGDYQHELGIIDSRFAPAGTTTGPAGVIMHWHVDDVPATLDRLLSIGATQLEPPQDRGAGFITASVVDPFGNILGIMENPRYVDVLNSIKKA